jgi:hypothetical protein
MRQKLFTLASVLSLLLCVATLVLWVRSRTDTGDGWFWYWYGHQINLETHSKDGMVLGQGTSRWGMRSGTVLARIWLCDGLSLHRVSYAALVSCDCSCMPSGSVDR